MLLAGKKILCVIAPRDFRDEELFLSRERFERAGAQVTVASLRTGQARGMLGGRAIATELVDGARADAYDAIVVIGGDGARTYLWGATALRRLVDEATTTDRLLGAICLAPAVFARAGLLAGREATIFPAPDAEDELSRAGARLVKGPVVVAGKVVTANGPAATETFAATLIDLLARRR